MEMRTGSPTTRAVSCPQLHEALRTFSGATLASHPQLLRLLPQLRQRGDAHGLAILIGDGLLIDGVKVPPVSGAGLRVLGAVPLRLSSPHQGPVPGGRGEPLGAAVLRID